MITVPAYFSDAQRQATRDAGELAGLEVVRIINEPTAAALAYESGHVGSRNILVYDLGGGTFDVSVVRLTRDVTEVLASHGNNRLGGDDFDARLVEHLLQQIQDRHAVDLASNRAAMARLQRTAEAAKITLSDAPYAEVREEYLFEHGGQPIHLSTEIARTDYEALIAAYADETLDAVHITLAGAGLTVSDLDEVLLVGGATRTPLIRQRLEEVLGMAPRQEIDPELCVATGAAIQAAVIAGQQVNRVLVDVTPYTFGTNAWSELDGQMYPFTFVPLIHKNTPIPVTKSEAFRTIDDGQTAIDVRVFQGENADALENTEIGSFRIEGLSDVPAGNVIVTTFALDVDGILHVSSREKRTGLEKRIRIENATARFAEEELGAARARLAALIDGEAELTEDPAPSASRTTVQAQALVEKAERLLGEANPEDREDLVDHIEAVRDALTADDSEALRQAVDALSDLVFYLES